MRTGHRWGAARAGEWRGIPPKEGAIQKIKGEDRRETGREGYREEKGGTANKASRSREGQQRGHHQIAIKQASVTVREQFRRDGPSRLQIAKKLKGRFRKQS